MNISALYRGMLLSAGGVLLLSIVLAFFGIFTHEENLLFVVIAICLMIILGLVIGCVVLVFQKKVDFKGSIV